MTGPFDIALGRLNRIRRRFVTPGPGAFQQWKFKLFENQAPHGMTGAFGRLGIGVG